jgi:hypothetical protein
MDRAATVFKMTVFDAKMGFVVSMQLLKPNRGQISTVEISRLCCERFGWQKTAPI